MDFYKAKKLPYALPAGKKKGMEQYIDFLWNITGFILMYSPGFYETRAKESSFMKFQFVFFYKIYYNRM